jgi:hypothetical protein
MNQKTFSRSRIPLAIVGSVGVLLLVLQAWAPAAAQVQVSLAGKWDRLNPDPDNPTPEHEVLRCGGDTKQVCVYDKQPEPLLAFENPPDSTFGLFRGEDITAGWACPGWFPKEVCESAVFVAGGTMNFRYPDGTNRDVNQELVVTDNAGGQVLFVHWVDQQFACPWFRGFGEALAANPFPTPFNGDDWPSGDCIFP